MVNRLVRRSRACTVALAVAGASLFVLAGVASAETYNASTTEQFVEAVAKANGNPGANTIVLATGGYIPHATVVLTNTSGLQTIEGSASAPGARINGTDVEPIPSEVLKVNASVSAKLKNLVVTGSGEAPTPAIDDAGSLEVEGSTLGNNGADIHVEPGATGRITNSTLSDGLDFGLVSSGSTSLVNSTVAFNGHGGIDNKGTLSLTNTIVAQNNGGDCTSKGANTSDHSLDSDGSCGVGALSKTNPKLMGLAFNGGPTQTHALEIGSPAIDAGDTAACPAFDQRGAARPDFLSTTCDIGAYEFYDPPHFLRNGTQTAVGEKVQTIGWGTVTLEASTGNVTCHYATGGNVENATSGPKQETVMVASWECKAVGGNCTGGEVRATPKALPWLATVFEAGTPGTEEFRYANSGVELNIECYKEGKNTENVLFKTGSVLGETGTLTPREQDGTTATKPSEWVFDSGSGHPLAEIVKESKKEAIKGTMKGSLKFVGYLDKGTTPVIALERRG